MVFLIVDGDPLVNHIDPSFEYIHPSSRTPDDCCTCQGYRNRVLAKPCRTSGMVRVSPTTDSQLQTQSLPS